MGRLSLRRRTGADYGACPAAGGTAERLTTPGPGEATHRWPQVLTGGRGVLYTVSAVTANSANTDVWTYDAARDALTRLTSDPGVDRNPVWTPDGQRLVYASSRGAGSLNLYWQRADGSGDETLLTTSPNVQSPGSWHPSGRF